MCVHALWCFSSVGLGDPMDCSPPGSSVHGIPQARILEWVAMPSSQGSSQSRHRTHVFYVSCIGRLVLYHRCHLRSPYPIDVRVCACMLRWFSHVLLFATLWTAFCQAPLSMGFSRQEYWSGLPCPLPGDLPNPGIKPTSPSLLHWQAGSLPLAPPGKTTNNMFKNSNNSIHLYCQKTRGKMQMPVNNNNNKNR